MSRRERDMIEEVVAVVLIAAFCWFLYQVFG